MQTETNKPLWKVLNDLRTKTKWEYKISTPTQESEKYEGKDAGALAHLFTYDGSTLMGRPNSKTIAYWPHWRNESETPENSANIEYTALAVNNLHHLAEALQQLVNRIEDNWDVITSGKVNGTKSGILHEAKEALNKIS